MFKHTQPVRLIPASAGESMQPFIHWIQTYSTLRPKNVFEIGANMAQDAEWLRQGFGLEAKDVWVFEPHPQLFNFIKETYSFNAFDSAVLDRTGTITINAIDLTKSDNSGISSARVHKDVSPDLFIKVDVESIRMDSFMQQHDIESIDFLKLDVEGCNFEVLEGFGDDMGRLKALHVEAEHHEHWEGEKLWADLRALLEPHMEMVFFERHFTQSDSFWIQKEYIRAEP